MKIKTKTKVSKTYTLTSDEMRVIQHMIGLHNLYEPLTCGKLKGEERDVLYVLHNQYHGDSECS